MNAAVLQAIMKPIWNPMQWKQPQSYSFASNQQKRMVKLSNCKWFSVLHPLTSNLWFPFSSHFTHIYLSPFTDNYTQIQDMATLHESPANFRHHSEKALLITTAAWLHQHNNNKSPEMVLMIRMQKSIGISHPEIYS